MKTGIGGKRYFIRGKVQGVGYRYFAVQAAKALGVSGWVRNVDDGRVEVFAMGTPEQLSQLEAALWKGPRWADIRGVDVEEAALESRTGFDVRHSGG